MIRLQSRDAALQALFTRPGYPPEIEKSVSEILENVRLRGDAALEEYVLKLDHVALKSSQFRVTEEEIRAASSLVSRIQRKAIRAALKNIQSFAKKQKPKNYRRTARRGVILGEQFTPMERVGVYIPGGTAPLVSTVIHTAGIAAAAGVREIVAVTPPNTHPAVLYAMHLAGVTEIYRLGGVYGIAALAYGTETIRPVEKVVGPGNAYVTAAKKLVFGKVAIDMVAGPSEIMVIADRTAPPEFIAADFLSQAEHGSGLEQSVLVSDSEEILSAVEQEVERQKKSLPRLATVEKVLAKSAYLILCKDMAEAADIAGKYAPEHLEIMTENPEKIARKVRAAGAIFLGPWTPEPAGDFCAGPSHVLPTAGSAKSFRGLSAETFFRRSSIVRYDRDAIQRDIWIIEEFAGMEGLAAHGKSGSIRRQKPK